MIKPKPQAQKKLEGTYRPDRDPGTDDRLSGKKPTCPTWLDKYAKGEWRRMANELHRAGLLKFVDRAALAGYCQAYSRWRKAEELVQQSGLLIKTTNGNVIQNPSVGIANRAMRDMLNISKEFGMTPSARSRLSVPDPGVKELTLADELMSIVNGQYN